MLFQNKKLLTSTEIRIKRKDSPNNGTKGLCGRCVGKFKRTLGFTLSWDPVGADVDCPDK